MQVTDGHSNDVGSGDTRKLEIGGRGQLKFFDEKSPGFRRKQISSKVNNRICRAIAETKMWDYRYGYTIQIYLEAQTAYGREKKGACKKMEKGKDKCTKKKSCPKNSVLTWHKPLMHISSDSV